MNKKSLTVVVLGASAKTERISNMAVSRLKEDGHTPIPVHPSGRPVANLETLQSLDEVRARYLNAVHTVTVYVNAGTSSQLQEEILALAPSRVIFNPGAENPSLAQTLQKHGVEILQACTLVLLRTQQF